MAVIDNSTIGAKIGKYIKYQRKKKGYSLNELSRITGLDTSFLMRLEKNVYKSIKFDVVEKLAGGLQMSFEDFLIKCEILTPQSGYSNRLPSLEYYLKEKYQFPDEAIEHIGVVIDVLQKKYKMKIKEMEKAHNQYWKIKQ